jgi:hypothetical protein
MLAGGPGVDRFGCGRGRDVVYTTSSGGVSRDCEIVHRTAASAADGAAGMYRGDLVSFRLAPDSKSISGLRIDFNGQCPAGTTARIQILASGPFAVQPDGTFAVDEDEPGGAHVKLSGAIQSGGVASGSLDLQTPTCDTGTLTWTARRT